MPVQILDRPEGTLATKPRVGDALGVFLGNMIQGGIKGNQDKTIRRAAATILGIPEEQVPLGMFKQEDLVDLQKEKFKTEVKTKSQGEALKAALGEQGGTTQGGGWKVDEISSGGEYKLKRIPPPEEALKERADKLSDEVMKKQLNSMATQLPKLEQAEQSVNQLEKLYNKGASPDVNPTVSRISGPADALKAKMGFNPTYNSYINNRKAFAGLIAKGGFGEAGMLTNQDIERVVSALPSAESTPEEAKIAFEEIKTLLKSARLRYEKIKNNYLTGKDFVNTSDVTPGTQVQDDYSKYLQAIGAK